MAIEAIIFRIKCDDCDKMFESRADTHGYDLLLLDGYALRYTQLKESLERLGWAIATDGITYCPKCVKKWRKK